MRTIKKNFTRFELTDTERCALDIVNNLLHDIQCDFSNKLVLESAITGERVRVKDLARVRGILSFFQEDIVIAEIKEEN